MQITKSARAHWQGSLKEGSGTLSTQSKALQSQPYSFKTRFEEEAGTNPEELIGAALAGCYSMALAAAFENAGHNVRDIQTAAHVTLEKMGQGFEVTHIALKVQVSGEGFDDAELQTRAMNTKETCPISKLIRAKIDLSATRGSA